MNWTRRRWSHHHSLTLEWEFFHQEAIWSKIPSSSLRDLAEGPLTILVQEQDAAGNTVSVSRQVMLDTTAPEIVIFTPTDATINQVESQSPIQVQGLTEVGSIVQVEVVVSGEVLDTYQAAVSSTGQWSAGVDFSSLPDGLVIISATSTDRAGNEGEAQTVEFMKDTFVPSVTSDAPTSLVINGADASVTVSGTAESGSTVLDHYRWTDESVSICGSGRTRSNDLRRGQLECPVRCVFVA